MAAYPVASNDRSFIAATTAPAMRSATLSLTRRDTGNFNKYTSLRSVRGTEIRRSVVNIGMEIALVPNNPQLTFKICIKGRGITALILAYVIEGYWIYPKALPRLSATTTNTHCA